MYTNLSENWKRMEFGRPKHRWDYNIGMDLREIGGKVWTRFMWLRIGSKWRALVDTVMNFRGP
jgi:hypothetical protein